MDERVILAVNPESADVFSDFAQKYPELMEPAHNGRLPIGMDQVVEFIIAVTPALISALATYFAARIAASGKSIRIKKGNNEIEITNTDLSPEKILELLTKLIKKSK